MKIKILLLSIVFFCMNLFAVQAQEKDFKERRYTPDMAKFESFVKEAYGEKADALVFDIPIREKTLKDILRNRVTLVERYNKVPDFFTNLSTIPLLKYNSALSRDSHVDPKTFNPFKYNIDFYQTKKRQKIHIDGTSWYLVIEPLNIDLLNKKQ